MIGKREVLRRLRKSQRWSWGDVVRQTVPEASSSHRKHTIAI